MDKRFKNMVERVKEHLQDADTEQCVKFIEQCVEMELGHYAQHPCDTCEWQDTCELDDKKCEMYL